MNECVKITVGATSFRCAAATKSTSVCAVASCNHFTREVGASGGQRESPLSATCIHPIQPVAGNDIETFHWNAELLKYAPATPAVDSSLRILTADRFSSAFLTTSQTSKALTRGRTDHSTAGFTYFCSSPVQVVFFGGPRTGFLGFAFTFGRKRNVFLPCP